MNKEKEMQRVMEKLKIIGFDMSIEEELFTEFEKVFDNSWNSALKDAIKISREEVYVIEIEGIECGVIDIKKFNEKIEGLLK